MMRLIYLPANAAWAFTFGRELLRMSDEPMFFDTRREAVEAAKRHTLNVDRKGVVTS